MQGSRRKKGNGENDKRDTAKRLRVAASTDDTMRRRSICMGRSKHISLHTKYMDGGGRRKHIQDIDIWNKFENLSVFVDISLEKF